MQQQPRFKWRPAPRTAPPGALARPVPPRDIKDPGWGLRRRRVLMPAYRASQLNSPEATRWRTKGAFVWIV